MTDFDLSDLFGDDDSTSDVAVADEVKAEPRLAEQPEHAEQPEPTLPAADTPDLFDGIPDADASAVDVDGPQPGDETDDETGDTSAISSVMESLADSDAKKDAIDQEEERRKLEHNIGRVSVEIARLDVALKAKRKYREAIVDELGLLTPDGSDSDDGFAVAVDDDSEADYSTKTTNAETPLAENQVLVRFLKALTDIAVRPSDNGETDGEQLSFARGDETVLTVDDDGNPFLDIDGVEGVWFNAGEFEIVRSGKDESTSEQPANTDESWRTIPTCTLFEPAIKGCGTLKEAAIIAEAPTLGDFEDLRCKVGTDADSLHKLLPNRVGEGLASELEERLLNAISKGTDD